MGIKKDLQKKLFELGGDTVLIHSDLMQGFRIPFSDRESFLVSHINELISLGNSMNIWMPAFNYDFCKGKSFDVELTPSQVGPFTEYFRKKVAVWRTPIPVFSFSGTGDQPVLNTMNTIDPFGDKSAFQLLYSRDALLMHYGSPINTTTILHYSERKSGNLMYRYDKIFKGQVVINKETIAEVKFNFHVRPFGKHLDYDWIKIKGDLISNKILFVFEEGSSRLSLCRIKDLIDFWVKKINDEPFYLLDQESKEWIEPLVDILGRPFLISDFEPSKEL